MTDQPTDVSFNWEDGGVAGLKYFTCVCGKKVEYPSPDGLTVSYDEEVECPYCKQKYRCIWRGMELVKAGRAG